MNLTRTFAEWVFLNQTLALAGHVELARKLGGKLLMLVLANEGTNSSEGMCLHFLAPEAMIISDHEENW